MSQKFLHHLGVGAGFAGLIVWFYFGRELGILEWVTAQVPESYSGAGVMLGIMIMMTPGFYLWTLFNRWMERKLAVTGTYYEDAYYEAAEKAQAEKEAQQAADAEKKD